ncbi:hypothetical protein [Arsenicicoccus sp. oral taxon 190]|uniref:hypothetical protein n=1 Tax=Arsenicicoccus sp. oral taxon 190 TaxID=1658671 RepID=UPI00067ABB14|nr:hypothetical protein [Arsenicicoccus sp. oral taxon 190]
MTRRPDEPRPSLSLVHSDDEVVQRLSERALEPADATDPVVSALGDWAAAIDRDLPADLREEPLPAPSRRTVIVTRAGVAASVAAVVLSGVSVAAAANEGGISGFMHKAERAVELGVAAPRPADPAVLATADVTTSAVDRSATRKALLLAQQRLAAGDQDGAGAVLALVQDQLQRDPGALDDADRTLLSTLRDTLQSAVVAAPAATQTGSDRTPRPGATSAAGRAPATAGGTGPTRPPAPEDKTAAARPTSPASPSPASPSPTSPASPSTSPTRPTPAPTTPAPTTPPTRPSTPTAPPTTPSQPPTSPTNVPPSPTGPAPSPTASVSPTTRQEVVPTPSRTTLPIASLTRGLGESERTPRP